jgi:ATP-binding cassette, subfamily F, member 2
VRGGLTEKVERDHVVKLTFTNVGKLPPPVLQFSNVTFGYSKDKVLYSNVSAHRCSVPFFVTASFG